MVSGPVRFALSAIAIPLIFNGLLMLGTKIPEPYFPERASAERPLVLIFPFVGAALLPAVVILWRYVFRINAITKLLGVVFTVVYFFHCFFTGVYGNINNDAYSDSWIVDVSAPNSYWNPIVNIPADYKLSHNATSWSEAIAGPHLPKFTCDGHTFNRFMCHRILKKSRVSPLLIDEVMFCGSWVMVERVDGKGKAKVFTDFAFGNDHIFNQYLSKILVDTRNLYNTFNNSLNDAQNKWTIKAMDIPPLYKGPVIETFETTGKVFPPAGRNHIQDQYSCMNEAFWLKAVTGNQWCFYKMMEAKEDIELKGTIQHPMLKNILSFPSGDMSDCSKPVVRAVLTKGLHWLRDNYLC